MTVIVRDKIIWNEMQQRNKEKNKKSIGILAKAIRKKIVKTQSRDDLFGVYFFSSILI